MKPITVSVWNGIVVSAKLHNLYDIIWRRAAVIKEATRLTSGVQWQINRVIFCSWNQYSEYLSVL